MNARAGSGWQTALADLSLILFMATASVLGDPAPPPPPPSRPLATELPALAEPVAVWRAGAGAPALRDWLAASGGDPNLRLTIVAPAGEAEAALALARAAGRPARLVLEPGGSGAPMAALTYDRPERLAQSLHSQVAKPAL
jgi:hypothetical protein